MKFIDGGARCVPVSAREAADLEAKAFDLDHLIDVGTPYGWPRAVTRVFLIRHPDASGDPECYTAHRMSDGHWLGCGDTKDEATREAAYRLQRLK